MTLVAGTKLGPYEITGAIGAGGMGEVYRARDTKLGRDVALKVLPEALAADPERLARMRREAQVLASLNHPNIAAIYGFEDSGRTHALVMELVEGPTLAERIKSGAIPPGEALPMAKQICEGLEYAHERGIIHRDLKPSNVKITAEGNAKILDFGLAKALEGDAVSADISSSPTISRMATQAGIILGTAVYMSPEQAKGKTVDRRADIWSFGCVLYEMLTGETAFSGETVTDTLAAVIKSEPDWSQVPTATPARIRELLQRCLKKDVRQRLQSVGDARIAIDDIISGVAQNSSSYGATVATVPVSVPRWRHALPWAGMAVLAIVAAIFAAGYVARTPRPAQTIVSEIEPPTGESFAFAGQQAAPPVLSPDGKKLAFAALGPSGKEQLWVRPLDSATAQPLAGTDGGTFPFWSPDSRDLGFFANGKLERIDTAGGPPQVLCDSAAGRGGTWGADGTILFTPEIMGGVSRVPSVGGMPNHVAGTGSESSAMGSGRWPQFLPDGKHFLFFRYSGNAMESGTYVQSLDGGKPKLLLQGFSNAVYAAPGYLLFIEQGALMAERFDAGELRLTGNATPIAENVVQNFVVFRSTFSVSDSGMLVYQGGANGGTFALLRYDRSGKQIGEIGVPGEYYSPRLSPDGSKLAVAVRDAKGNNLWIFDLTRNVKTQLTFSGSDISAAWSPDGKTLAFESARGKLFHLCLIAADGTGKTTPLVDDNANEYNPVWSADGRYLLYERSERTTPSQTSVWALPMFGNRKPFQVVNSQFVTDEPALSTDGKWLAYVSRESDQPEVYLARFGPEGANGRWQVSTNGGMWPEWRRDGKELFYDGMDGRIMAAEIDQHGSQVSIGQAQALFQTNYSGGPGWTYDASADGRTFLVISQGAQHASEPLTLVVNWPALLKRQ